MNSRGLFNHGEGGVTGVVALDVEVKAVLTQGHTAVVAYEGLDDPVQRVVIPIGTTGSVEIQVKGVFAEGNAVGQGDNPLSRLGAVCGEGSVVQIQIFSQKSGFVSVQAQGNTAVLPDLSDKFK